MFEGKKRAANFSGYKTGHGVLHVNKAYLNAKQSKIPSHRNGGSGIGGDLSYTGVLKFIGSAPLLFSGFFTPLLRSIALAVVHPIMGMLEYRKALDCPMTVRHPHLNWWISNSQIIGGLK
jgi:hypothetical protein